MASTYVATKDQPRPNHHRTSPQNSFKKAWAANPQPPPPPAPSCALPKCVCAPATHAGSFKCRLHRVDSHGPTSPPASSSASSTRTIEAQ